MSARADPLPGSKCRCQHWIITDTSIRIDEPFGFKGIWIWIHVRIMKDRPSTKRVVQDEKNRRIGKVSHHMFITIIEPGIPISQQAK